MATPCFYHPELSEQDTSIVLIPAEADHATKSRRLGVGQQVRIINGFGLVAEGIIEQAGRKAVQVELKDIATRPRPAQSLAIASAVPKGDRQKVLVDMLTQLGCSQIVPLHCDYSVAKFSPKLRDKWQRAAIEACKQSHNPWLPEISELIGVREYLSASGKGIAYADSHGKQLSELISGHRSITIMIGPEGGFSPAERALFEAQRVPSVSLGAHILRTEVAAITAAAQWALAH